MPSVLVLLLTLGAITRLTRLVTSDVLTEPIRAAVERRYGDASKIAYLLSCPWCFSVWASFPVAWAAIVSHGAAWFTVPALALTASLVAAIVVEIWEDWASA